MLLRRVVGILVIYSLSCGCADIAPKTAVGKSKQHYHAGLLLKAHRRFELAIKQFELSVKNNPFELLALSELKLLYQKLGNTEKAKATSAAIEKNGELASFLSELYYHYKMELPLDFLKYRENWPENFPLILPQLKAYYRSHDKSFLQLLTKYEDTTTLPSKTKRRATPNLCLGDRSIGGDTLWYPPWLCSKNQAIYGLGLVSGRKSSPANVGVRPVCCPLPSNDILTNENLYRTNECPDDYVATGRIDYCLLYYVIGQYEGVSAKTCPTLLRCTKIDTTRYKLNPETPGAFWGSGSTYYLNTHRLAHTHIPISIRNAMGRNSRYNWDTQGCVGLPFGSLLTKKSFKRCQGFSFKQLSYRNKGSRTTAVPMFPECETISDKFDPNAKCVPKKRSN